VPERLSGLAPASGLQTSVPTFWSSLSGISSPSKSLVVGHAEVPDLAGPREVIEHTQHLLDRRHRIEGMQLICMPGIDVAMNPASPSSPPSSQQAGVRV
jgi:hypothetical protein